MEWLNQVDSQYLSDLRELNELNFARFDAKIEQRFVEQDARIERRFAEQEAKFERRFAEFEVRIDGRLAAFEASIAQQFSAQTRFLYVALAAQVAPLAGLYLR